MICVETEYFILSKIFLRTVGLWPYQQSIFARSQFIFFLGILMATIIFQLTTLITSKCTTNLIIRILSSVLFFIILWIKCISFHIHIEDVKNISAYLQCTCNKIKEENEVAIIKKYGYNARRFTAALAIFGTSCIFMLIIGQFWSNILDIILPKNNSRPHNLPIIMEYFIDQEKYFYLILFHLHLTILMGSITMLAIGTWFIAFLQYICGMFKVASHRMEHAMASNIFQNINWKNDTLIFKRLVHAIDIHRQTVKVCNHFMRRFETLFLFLIICGVICLSLNLIQICQVTISTLTDIDEFILSIVLTALCIFYMFISNYVGQEITDHNEQIYVTVYNIQWYKAPLSVQKLILFLLQKGIKNFTLSVGGLFDASFECFAMLVKTSVSYFTVIYSTR
ncbi:hypothetical protein HN011_008379 [Eciton burchellii]|nr:hypothetical protein HN011_008379 [Eciton burchellii]